MYSNISTQAKIQQGICWRGRLSSVGRIKLVLPEIVLHAEFDISIRKVLANLFCFGLQFGSQLGWRSEWQIFCRIWLVFLYGAHIGKRILKMEPVQGVRMDVNAEFPADEVGVSRHEFERGIPFAQRIAASDALKLVRVNEIVDLI